MPVATAKKIQTLSQASDPRKAIQEAVGDLSDETVLGDLVLVGVYIRPEKTIGGIIRPQTNVQEDEFQGKVGLVLKKGPLAYAEWEADESRGMAASVGDWVVFAVKDGWSLTLGGAPCRLIPYERIRMNITDPERIF